MTEDKKQNLPTNNLKLLTDVRSPNPVKIPEEAAYLERNHIKGETFASAFLLKKQRKTTIYIMVSYPTSVPQPNFTSIIRNGGTLAISLENSKKEPYLRR